MDAQLSQRAARVFHSPYFEVMDVDTKALTNRLVKAFTFNNLSAEDKELIELGEKSRSIAQELSLFPPYKGSDIKKVIVRLEKDTGKSILSARDDEEIEIEI